MRVAFISTILGYPWGGADTLWTHAAEAAIARGDRLLLSVSPLVAAHPRIVALGAGGATIQVRTRPPPIPSLRDRVLRKLVRSRFSDSALIAPLERFQPDLVVISQGGAYDLLLHRRLSDWLRTSRTKFRLIVNWQQEHPVLEEDDLAFICDAFAAADAIHFVSTRNLAVTRRHLLSPLPNARVVHNPLRWQPADSTPWPESPEPRLVTVSRLEESKGIDLLLHALAEAGPSPAGWQLDIFGQGPVESRLRATAAHFALGERVRFRGYVTDLRAIWAENQLMCSPSLDEGVPMTIPEAMLCGRPVLATCVGGAEDWIEHGSTGFLCPAPTLPLLTASLREAFAVRDRWATMGRAAAAAASARQRADDYLLLIA